MKNQSKASVAEKIDSLFVQTKQKKRFGVDDSECTFSNPTELTRDTYQEGEINTNNEAHSSLSTRKPILVLDLDETLIHAFKRAPRCSSIEVEIPKYNRTVWVVTRPGLKNFIQKMAECYELVIYTTSVIEYAEAILETINLRKYFSRVYDRKYCYTSDEAPGVKDLSVIGSDFKKMILIDDLRKHTSYQPDNSIQVPAFIGDREDCWLQTICPFLEKLSALDDLRSVSTRFNDYMLETFLYQQYSDGLKTKAKEDPSALTEGLEDDTEDEERDGLTAIAKAQVTATKRLMPCFKKIVPPSSGVFETSV